MNLVLDLGNTTQKCYLFEGDRLVDQFISPAFDEAFFNGIFDEFSINQAIIASVLEPGQISEVIVNQRVRTITLSAQTLLPIQNRYATPETLGNDRLAVAVAAAHLAKGCNVLAIDAGTCIKYELVTAEGAYLGGAISPGLNMRLRSMHNFTARLPLIELSSADTHPPLVGSSTRNALLSGALTGAVAEVEGMIDRYGAEYPDLTVLMTGGDAPFFELHVKRQIFARPNLVAEGLNTILNYNLNKH